jgi:hypothetical protein
MKSKLANISLICLTLSFLILLGGGNYEAINVTSVVAKAPPKSLSMLQGPYGFRPMWFWIIFHTLTEILFVIALIFNWRISLFRRRMILGCFAGLIIVRIMTRMYFAPETGVIASAPFSDSIDPVLQQRTQLWQSLNFLRLFAYYVIGVLLLITVSKISVDRPEGEFQSQ